MTSLVYALLPLVVLLGVNAVCPGQYFGTPPANHSPIPTIAQYNALLENIDIKAIMTDITALFTESQDCWPADDFDGFQTYGPFFIRLAWHCSGSFRDTDGAGGCGGGRQRFEPERSWDDNTNLDKARGLLWPIKDKYGDALSWGDLFTLAGTTAIYHMGGPVTQFCVGRVDDSNGTNSLPLGPGPKAPPCPVQGNCSRPLGTSTIGLIYVNPEGFMGQPDPKRSSFQVRDVFSRMGFDDRETVALIGGGHAFGKSHGACPAGAGLPPKDAPLNPWPGLCGTGKGNDTFTSGIEGAWTTIPYHWDNEYFNLILNNEYVSHKGPGDKWQWKLANNPESKLMMMTTDISLIYDAAFKAIVAEFANDQSALDKAFGAAWEKLITDGGTWAENSRCFQFSDIFDE